MTISTPVDRPVLDPALLAAAQAAGVNIAATCNMALARAIEAARSAELRAETAAAIAEWNDWAG